ncbi:MAG: twin transmembrane helix small protein [Gammaproteobacteria bacterium]|nr:twin transmembrane helix small protein [Gammaproteobacteria bacterium]
MHTLLNIVIVVVMVGIIVSLGSGLYYLVTDRGESNRTVVSLSVRVGLAIVLLVVLAYGLTMRYGL